MKSYIIFGQDNDKYAYDTEKAIKCDICGQINREKNKRQEFKKLKYDISSTYDNETLVSKRVYDALIKYVSSDNFEKSGNYYYLIPEEIVQFDSKKRNVKFGDICTICEKPSHIIGSTPAFLREEIGGSGIYSTDLHFGDAEDYGATLTPDIIVTEDILEILLTLKLTGLDYEATYC